jgi:hypothetical protein
VREREGEEEKFRKQYEGVSEMLVWQIRQKIFNFFASGNKGRLWKGCKGECCIVTCIELVLVPACMVVPI